MVAFFYVEPSCSCPVGDASFTAFVNKHGPPAIDGQPQVGKAFDGVCSAIPDQSGPHFALQVDWHFARCCGAIVHLQLHALDGLGHMSLISGVPD